MNKNDQTNNKSLAEKKCKPCEDKTGRLDHGEVLELNNEIDHWHIFEDKKIEKSLQFVDFVSAMAFVNKVAIIAEQENHHPDIHITDWNKVKLSLSTHSLGGLSENDFILAAKIDEISNK